jgi:DNA invertase Pin-like site-specific DNA recombinase
MQKRLTTAQSARTARKTGFVAYYRVSTDKQGESGLGLEAQQEAARRIARHAPILAEFIEVETAKRSNAANRPELLAAIEEVKRRNATLLIAKLDRLARNVFFISGLMESGVDFVAADMPQANRLTVHIMAAFAEYEARAISERTKAALAALKARGVKLGNPKWQTALVKARAARLANNPKPSEELVHMIERMRLDSSLRMIADRLNALGLKTPRGGRWHSTTVRGIIRDRKRIWPPRPVTTGEVKALLQQYRAEGLTIRAIVEKVNGMGMKTPTGAAWHPSTVLRELRQAR